MYLQRSLALRHHLKSGQTCDAFDAPVWFRGTEMLSQLVLVLLMHRLQQALVVRSFEKMTAEAEAEVEAMACLWRSSLATAVRRKTGSG